MINKKTVKRIREHYHSRGHNNDYATNNLGFGFIHYALIRNLLPERVLAIGSQRGYVPAHLAIACRENEKGYVDFVDCGLYEDEQSSWGGIGIWRNWDSFRHTEYWRHVNVQDWIKVHPKTTEEFMKSNNDTWDYIYIDGDHSFEGVKRDFELTWARLNLDGFMVFHDVTVDKETKYGQCGVKKFWDTLKVKSSERMTLPFDCGLGILRKL